MITPQAIYSLLAEKGRSDGVAEQILLGINWTIAQCRLNNGGLSTGLCFSPISIPRNLPWSGSLSGQPTRELTRWISSEDPCEMAIALGVTNAVINRPDNPLLRDAEPLHSETHPHLAVFDHFAPQLAGANVAIIGRYPQLENYRKQFEFVCIERRPGPGDLPESAATWALPRADWVFITASSIANRSLPQLLELSRNARVVLMGPSMPWLPEWVEFGVDYLAGVEVTRHDSLRCIVGEAGGTRIFGNAVNYRLLSLS